MSSSSAKMTSPGFGETRSVDPRSMKSSSPVAKRTVVDPAMFAGVEHGDGHGVADRDEVADVDERADGGDVAMLGQSSQQRFGRAAVLGRLGPEPGKGPPPCRDRGEIRDRRGLQPFGGGSLLGSVLVEQLS
jgi:hypothetical protein